MPAGRSRERRLARTIELDGVLDLAHIEDFTVSNDDRTPRDIASEVVTRARWIPLHPLSRRLRRCDRLALGALPPVDHPAEYGSFHRSLPSGWTVDVASHSSIDTPWSCRP